MDSLSKRDQMRREEVIIDKDRVESVLYQTVGNKRLRELCIDYWYLWVSKLTSCEGFSKNNSNNLSHWSTKQLFQMFAVFMCLCLCIWAHGRWQDQDGGKEERKGAAKKGWKKLTNKVKKALASWISCFFFFYQNNSSPGTTLHSTKRNSGWKKVVLCAYFGLLEVEG